MAKFKSSDWPATPFFEKLTLPRDSLTVNCRELGSVPLKLLLLLSPLQAVVATMPMASDSAQNLRPYICDSKIINSIPIYNSGQRQQYRHFDSATE
jgi:hypothetical protein